MNHGGLSDEHGASATEYALLIAGIAAVIVLAVFTLGGPVIEMFTDTCDELEAQPTVSTSCN